MFGARRYPEARKAFETLRPIAAGDDREVVDLRLAECDYYQKRFQVARDAIKPYTTKGSRKGEALFFYALAVGDLGDRAEFLTTVRRIVDEFPTESWAEEALNNQATRHIVDDQDDEADAVFRELYEKYPGGSYAERAAWKAGWRAYRQERTGRHRAVLRARGGGFPTLRLSTGVAVLGRARARSPEGAGPCRRALHARGRRLHELVLRAPRPQAPRWPHAGAACAGRAHVSAPAAGQRAGGSRAAVGRSVRRGAERASVRAAGVGRFAGHPGDHRLVHRKKGLSESNTTERFNLLRGSITQMRRAYPQFMAAGGQDLPRDILVHIFPIAYWDLIRKYSEQNSLDPYLIAALMAQESTFVPGIRSHANAYGLHAAVAPHGPSAGAQDEDPVFDTLADRSRGQRADGNGVLRRPGPRIRRLHLVLASYNAGETAVRRWINERPGLTDREEFIDDIPYPETQNYVKRILGTAEDYRRLYGSS